MMHTGDTTHTKIIIYNVTHKTLQEIYANEDGFLRVYLLKPGLASFFATVLPFPGQNIKHLKVINQDTYKKAYHIYSMYD